MAVVLPRLFCLVAGSDDLLLLPALADAGVRGFQVRDKCATARELVELTRIVLDAVRDFDATVVVNDRLDVALATGAHGRLLRRLRHYVVPVYDYALMTEPLTDAQLASVGWRHRQGVGDAGNQFHYYRLSADNRILWGGYDAVYYPGGRITTEHDLRDATFAVLAEHFAETFPQLAGIRFTHKWGGVIDACSRFSGFFGTAYRGRLAYAVGYTGLGVGASRFGAKVMLDLLGGRPTELTGLAMVRRKPVPFPPEPVRTGVIQLTRWSIARADRHDGRRNLWLRTLDRVGLGFDS